MDMDRRELLKKMAALGLTVAGADLLSRGEILRIIDKAQAGVKKSLVVFTEGDTVLNMVKKTVDRLGGIGKFVKKGAKVVIKPNAGWAMTPAQAANTHPLVVDALIQICKSAGAGSIKIYEHSCDNPDISFEKSGIMAVCRKHNVPAIAGTQADLYREVSIPAGKKLKSMKAFAAILDADCYINVPIIKVHGGATVTISMKNQMGCVEDRGYWHRNGLHQCIADAATILKPHLCVLDATRLLLTGGPRGPGKIKKEGKIIAGTDMVALDAYGATLLGYKPEQIGHIVLAQEMGLGNYDFKKIDLVKV